MRTPVHLFYKRWSTLSALSALAMSLGLLIINSDRILYIYIRLAQTWGERSRILHSQFASQLGRNSRGFRFEVFLDRYRNESCSELSKIDVLPHIRKLIEKQGLGQVFLLGDSTIRNKFEYLAQHKNHSSCNISYIPRTHESVCTNVFGVEFYYEPVMLARRLKATVPYTPCITN